MPTSSPEFAVLGGGCFWCLEAVFDRVEGVLSVESGYCGGPGANANYREVCDGHTGHAEVVRVEFNPAVISYREILEIFFGSHDPTTLNRQGNDIGTQYRSVIFAQAPDQQATAKALIEELNREQVFGQPVVTELAGAAPFWAAEDYHQDYFARNPLQPYCLGVVGPKVAKFRQKYAHRLKKGA